LKKKATLKSHSLSTHGASCGHPSIQKNVVDIEKEGLSQYHEHPDFILVEASITSTKRDDCWYIAFPLLYNNFQCNKKVTTTEEGNWYCQRCNQTFVECDYRFIFHFTIEDHTGTTNVTTFQEVAETLIKILVRQLYALIEEENNNETTKVFGNLFFNKYIFKLLIHENTFGNDKQMQSIVIASDKIESKLEGKKICH
jgi:replication factor A1